MSDRHEQARAEAERQYRRIGGMPRDALCDFKRLSFMRGVEWADANPKPHPRPGGGCQCTGYSQDAGGGYFEYLVEYEPACPEHSEHVYNPRTGAWEHANPQPHAITREAAMKAWLSGEDFADFADALKAAGIEMTDDAD